MRNEASSEQDIARGGNVVSGFVPEIGQAQQRQVQQKNEYKDDAEYQGCIRA
jgi:hypothetical protein